MVLVSKWESHWQIECGLCILSSHLFYIRTDKCQLWQGRLTDAADHEWD